MDGARRRWVGLAGDTRPGNGRGGHRKDRGEPQRFAERGHSGAVGGPGLPEKQVGPGYVCGRVGSCVSSFEAVGGFAKEIPKLFLAIFAQSRASLRW